MLSNIPEENLHNNLAQPKSGLNFVLYNSRFDVVEENTGYFPVEDHINAIQNLATDLMVMTEAGFLEIFVNNQAQTPVYYDNLMVVSRGGSVTEVNAYYPSGLLITDLTTATGNLADFNAYKYNDKEWQKDVKWLDYGARMYDPVVGRWWLPDPFAELYYSTSPYAYCLNNPIRFFDPDGRIVRDANGNIVARTVNSNATYFSGTQNNNFSYSATQVNILTNGGKTITGYVANNSTVNITTNGVETSTSENFDNSYNCTGNALADQTMAIGSNEITESILKSDGFAKLGASETPNTGDIAAIKKGGVFQHFERFTSPTTVNSKGGIEKNRGNQPPGTSPFSQEKGSKTSVWRKEMPDRVTNVNLQNSLTKDGITYVSGKEWREIKSEQRQIRKEERRR